MGDGGAGGVGGNANTGEGMPLGTEGVLGGMPSGNIGFGDMGFGGGQGLGGYGVGEQGPATGGVMPTTIIAGGGEIKGGEAPKVEEAKKAIKRSTRRRTLLSDEEGGLEPVPIYRRSILGS